MAYLRASPKAGLQVRSQTVRVPLDADVVLHAVTDALLGAAGLPDIGDLFPDTDDAFKDADSRELLTDVIGRIGEKGFRVGNVDVIVHAESPKMSARWLP